MRISTAGVVFCDMNAFLGLHLLAQVAWKRQWFVDPYLNFSYLSPTERQWFVDPNLIFFFLYSALTKRQWFVDPNLIFFIFITNEMTLACRS